MNRKGHAETRRQHDFPKLYKRQDTLVTGTWIRQRNFILWQDATESLIPFSGKFHQQRNQASNTCMITSDGITSTKCTKYKCGGYNYFCTHSIQFKNEYMWMDVNREMWRGTVDVLHVRNVLSFQWIPHRQRIKKEFLQLFPEERNCHCENRSMRGARTCSKWFRVISCMFL